jgi:hypothetical protein
MGFPHTGAPIRQCACIRSAVKGFRPNQLTLLKSVAHRPQRSKLNGSRDGVIFVIVD